MYARLVSGLIPPEKLDSAIQLWHEAVLPSVQQQRGFRGVRLLVDRASGRIASMGLWATREDFEATVRWNDERVARFAGFFAAPPDVGGYELVVDVSAP